MKGSVASVRHSSKATEPEVKVKRKCGRPRNPIPRHKRVSHINAEHRRRGKIQNGFQTLKNMVPKYESSGRDSKADILTKAVEHCKAMKKQCKEQEKMLNELRAQQQALNADIQRHQQNLPEGKLFDDQPLTSEQRFNNLVSNRTEENWKYFIFSYIMKPLHQSFDAMTDCATRDSFVDTSIGWAKQNLSQVNLRPVVTEALRNLSTQTSFIDKPDLMPTEALQRCQKASNHVSATVTNQSSKSNGRSGHKHHASHRHSGGHKHHKTTSGHKHQSKSQSGSKRSSSSAGHNTTLLFPDVQPSSTKKSRGRQSCSQSVAAPPKAMKSESSPSCPMQRAVKSLPVKSETVRLPKVETVPLAQCAAYNSPLTDLQLSSADSPVSYDSAIELSPLGSSHDSSVFGDVTGYESSLDQGYDTPSVLSSSSTVDEDVFKHTHLSSMLHDSSSQRSSVQGVFADLENFDPPDFVDSIYESYESSSLGSSPESACPATMTTQTQQHQDPLCDSLASMPVDSFMLLDQADTSFLLDSVDQNLLNDPCALTDFPSRTFLSEDSHASFDFLLDYDYNSNNMGFGDSSLMAL